MTEINHDNVLIQIRDALNRNNVKLWEEPYCLAGESNENEIVKLANLLCQQLNIRYELCFVAISELQNTALDNLKSIDEFNETGIATLKVRIPSKVNGTKLLNFKIKLTEPAKGLQEMIAAKLETQPEKIKIIANGKVLDLQTPLTDQAVKNNKQIMALVTEASDASNAEDPYARIKQIRQEAELLLKNKSTGFLTIEDQSGKAIHLPDNERRSIIMALLLYEKGRVQLKKERFADALILFLEADNELQSCPSQLVQSVDNVALLNLDIVWCYLNLKSIMQLPDAENRLRICEESFKRSYGENLSRVETVKGSSENEKCLIARLHLMKGILYFHQNRRHEAKLLMESAEREIRGLKVDDNSVALLLEMGYSQSEAITGLRSCYNSIDGAVNFILERRQKFIQSRKEGKAERTVEKFISNLGLTANPRSVIALSENGFPKELCALALQKCNGDLQQALNLLYTSQNDLRIELVNSIKPSEKFIGELVKLGFERSLAESMLRNNVNDFQRALDALLDLQKDPTAFADFMNTVQNVVSGSSQPSTSSKSGSPAKSGSPSKSLPKPGTSAADSATRALQEEAAFDFLRNDLDHLEDDDEYLTMTLEKEEELLAQYKSALNI